MAFNEKASPKVPVKYFKLYIDVSEGSTSPTWELQGRGVQSWTLDESESVEKNPDVLGYVDVQRGIPQPQQSGVRINIRKDSKFGELLFNAWLTGDKSALDALSILHKFEFVDGKDESSCVARLEKEVLVEISSFEGEANNYLAFTCNFHYTNNRIIGTMPKEDGDTITFTPDTAA